MNPEPRNLNPKLLTLSTKPDACEPLALSPWLRFVNYRRTRSPNTLSIGRAPSHIRPADTYPSSQRVFTRIHRIAVSVESKHPASMGLQVKLALLSPRGGSPAIQPLPPHHRHQKKRSTIIASSHSLYREFRLSLAHLTHCANFSQ